MTEQLLHKSREAVSESVVLEYLNAWAQLQAKMAPPMETFARLTGAMPDCTLLAPIYEVWAAYTRLIAEKVGDDGDWLGYYEYECDMGAKPGLVSWTAADGTKEEVLLNSLETLAYVLTH